MKIALFAHGDHNHIGIVTDFETLDFSRAYQAQQLIQFGEESPRLITDMVTLMEAGLFNGQTFQSTIMFVYEHHLNGAFAVADPCLRTPIPRPGKLIALGGNYAHEGEEEPDEPPLFFKPTSSIIGPEQPIIFRRNLSVVEPEIELAVVIGRGGSHIVQAEAMEYVAGYTLLNDVTARDLQNTAYEVQRPWSYTKGIDTFTPIGPARGPAGGGQRSAQSGDDDAGQRRGGRRSQYQHHVVSDPRPDRVHQPVYDAGTGRHDCHGDAGASAGSQAWATQLSWRLRRLGSCATQSRRTGRRRLH